MRAVSLLLIVLAGTAHAKLEPKPPFPEAGRFLPTRLARFTLGVGSGYGFIHEQTREGQNFAGSGPTFHMSLGVQFKDVFSILASGGATAATGPRDPGGGRVF